MWYCTSSICGSIYVYCSLCGALPVPCCHRGLPQRVAHRYTYAPPRCRTSQYRRTLISLSVSLWNDLPDPVFDGVWLAGFKSRANAQCFYISQCCLLHFCLLVSHFLFFVSTGSYCGTGVFELIGVNRSLQPCNADLFLIIIITIILLIIIIIIIITSRKLG